MGDSARERHVSQIREAQRQLQTAGYIHRRDLQKQIRRMKKELKIYDFYMQQNRGDSRLRGRANTNSG